MELDKDIKILTEMIRKSEEEYHLNNDEIQACCEELFFKADLKIKSRQKKKKHIVVIFSSVAALLVTTLLACFLYNESLNSTNDSIYLNALTIAEVSDEIKLYTQQEELLIENDDVVEYSQSGEIISDNKSQKKIDTKENSIPPIEINRIVVPHGKFVKLILSDGTIVYANSGSQLVYPTVFDDKVREVALEGEGYFEVKKDVKRSFRVITKKTDVKVLGTSFNVRSYDSEENVLITLLEGSVEFKKTDGKYNKIKPNEQAIVNEQLTSVKTVHAENYIKWIEQIYVIPTNQKCGDVLKYLSNYYGVEITCSPRVSPLVLKGKLDLKMELPKVLNMATKPLNINWVQNGDTYEVF